MKLKNIESTQPVSDGCDLSETASILILPHEVIAKILQYKYARDRQLKNVYHMIRTCKEIYYNHVSLLYTLEPVVVSLAKYPPAVSLESLRLLNKTGINRWVKTLEWVLTPKITTTKKYQDAITSCISSFPNLTSVCLSVSSLDLLSHLTKLPASVTKLEINITTQVNPAWNMGDIPQDLPKLKLKVLKFKSFYPLSLKKYYYPIVRSTLVSKSPLYSWLAINDNIPHAHKNSPINQVCQILAALTYNAKSTLQYLHIEKLHPVFLFRVMDTVFYPVSFLKSPRSDLSDCNEFPELKLLKVDNSYLLTDNLLLKFLGKLKEKLIITDFMFQKEVIEVKIDEFQSILKIVHHRNEYSCMNLFAELKFKE
ncbi:hypothetical protein Cantr_03716 [Candida viswanathii]|uniref:Uncharacterized protein n=1 Tax=Candida viswanathii TaxID=5486 RepID=A0A367XPU5_9ASCO|nr:hypothetical protein Cantr_03716 [Candida viswanathii]